MYLTRINVQDVLVTPTVGLFLLAVCSGVTTCPSELFLPAHECFGTYSVSYHSMQRTQHKLCCGLDVETLRALCKSYVDGMRCISRLKHQCPAERHHVIDNALENLDGAREGLHDLCSDDTIIEKYAMYQSCFTFAGRASESCFTTHLHSNTDSGGATNIRFLSKVSSTDQADFCRRMSSTVRCVQRNVEQTCGQQAATLAAILVKPMVRHSADCHYTADVAHAPQDVNPSYTSDGHSPQIVGGGDSSNSAPDSRGGSSGVGGGDGVGNTNRNTRKREGAENRNGVSSHLGLSSFTVISLTLAVIFNGFNYKNVYL